MPDKLQRELSRRTDEAATVGRGYAIGLSRLARSDDDALSYVSARAKPLDRPLYGTEEEVNYLEGEMGDSHAFAQETQLTEGGGLTDAEESARTSTARAPA